MYFTSYARFGELKAIPFPNLWDTFNTCIILHKPNFFQFKIKLKIVFYFSILAPNKYLSNILSDKY